MIAVESVMSPSLKGLVGELMQNSGYISKIRKLTESLDRSSEIAPDDFTKLWSYTTDMLAVLDDVYGFVNVNDSWTALGYETNELKTMSLFDVILNSDLIKIKRRLKNHDKSVIIDIKLKIKDTTKSVLANLNISPIHEGKCYLIARIS